MFKNMRLVILFDMLLNPSFNMTTSFDNPIEEIISETSKFEKLSEDTTLKQKASLQGFLRKLKQKNFFNETEKLKILF